MKTFVIGDIHGAHRALKQCLERCGFDRQHDQLIVLGDVCDGWPQVHKCVEELLQIKDLIYIIGNHDLWTLGWAVKGILNKDWLEQGGRNTIASYGGGLMPEAHIKFLQNARWWYLDSKNRLFVHGGIDPGKPLDQQDEELLVWDRELIEAAYKKNFAVPAFHFGGYKEIFVGHTTTETFRQTVPLHWCNVWMLDTGGGWSGPLTIMDIESKEYWQSDPSPALYPGVEERKRH